MIGLGVAYRRFSSNYGPCFYEAYSLKGNTILIKIVSKIRAKVEL